MSRTPVGSPSKKGSVGSRSFERRRRQERERAMRRRMRRARSSRPGGLPQLKALLRRVPTIAWVCASIAILNATAWSIITPPFQGRDEVDHFAYTTLLAETGKQPISLPGDNAYSEEEGLVMEGLHYGEVRFTTYEPSISTDAQQATLTRDVNAGRLVANSPEAGGASSEPPLFYALQVIPYALGGGNMLIQLQLMRLFDALLGGLTALLVLLFLREAVPRVPWAASAAAICVALMPQFAFTTGSVNPDALLYPLSAAAFLIIARGFRRGLTIPLAIAFGGVIAAGFVTYFSFIGVALGAFAGLAVLGARDAWSRRRGPRALIAPGIAIGIGASPPLLYGLSNLASGHALLGTVSSTGKLGGTSIFDEISYIWQLYLPRLPGMTHYFEGISTWRDIWFDRSVGLYGWMDTMFPSWVDNLALALAVGVALLCGRELVSSRGEVRSRAPELLGYALIALGVLVMIGVGSYHGDVIERSAAFGEPRYLLPMLPLFGAAIALAIRGAGRRWVPVLGAAMIVLFLGHDLFSQLQVIARYYG